MDALSAALGDLQNAREAINTAIRILRQPGSPPPGGTEAQLVTQANDARELIDGQQHRLHDYSLRLEAAEADISVKRQQLLHRDRELAGARDSLRTLAEEGILPDGDGVDTPVVMWAEEVVAKIDQLGMLYEERVRQEERRAGTERLRYRMVALEDGAEFPIPEECRILLEFAVVETQKRGTKEWMVEFQEFRAEWQRRQKREQEELNVLLAGKP